MHDIALKAAETDATKRALATFGKPFGLALYRGGKAYSRTPTVKLAGSDHTVSIVPERTTPEPVLAETAPDPRAHPREQESSRDGASPSLGATHGDDGGIPGRIDKSTLTIGAPKRHRNKAHLRFVASQPCLICGRQPSDPHHLRFTQPRALGLKVSDEFTVPLCRGHHRQLHQAGHEVAWWADLNINALEIARGLWDESQTKGL